MTADALTRRDCLALLTTAGAVGLAGCSGGETDPGDAESTPTDANDRQPPPTETRTDDETVGVVATAVGLVVAYDADDTSPSTGESDLRTDVAAAMSDVAERDVRVDESEGIVEVRADGDPEALVAALDDAGFEVSPDEVRRGVTESTREEIVAVLDRRLAAAGYDDASVTLAGTSSDHGFLVDVPDAEYSEVADLVSTRGRVLLVATFPEQTEDGSRQREVTLVSHDGFERVGEVREGRGGSPPFVRVTLTPDAAAAVTEAMNRYGYTDEGVANCRWASEPDDPGWCVSTVVDGEVIYAAGIAPGLAEIFRNDEFADERDFLVQARDVSTVERLQRHLEVGPLPTPLAVEPVE